MFQKYFIKTFGCQQNEADSERLAAMLEGRGMEKAESLNDAHHVIINTCMVREMAENRVYGAVNNLAKKKIKTGMPEKIILTGCMVGMAVRDKSGKFLKLIKKRLPDVDEFLPIEEVGFAAIISALFVLCLLPVDGRSVGLMRRYWRSAVN
ncbi:hypothetical protein HZB96_02150 [Candidatus Gottesmanbacteria bacterium]|nr:hypothetical protein [Candidatus Gottesmanbacteria bacterium]